MINQFSNDVLHVHEPEQIEPLLFLVVFIYEMDVLLLTYHVLCNCKCCIFVYYMYNVILIYQKGIFITLTVLYKYIDIAGCCNITMGIGLYNRKKFNNNDSLEQVQYLKSQLFTNISLPIVPRLNP